MPRRFAPAWIALAWLLAAPLARAQIQTRIVNGLPSQDYPTAGALLLGSDPNTATSWCSGTLIGCNTFLTAAHCVCSGVGSQCQPPNAPNPGTYQVFLQHGGLYPVQSITVRPDFNFPVGDVAIVKLGAPVSGISPTPIDTIQAPANGTSGTIVGFGRSGGTSFDYGTKRAGTVTTGPCPIFVSPVTSVCWTFDANVGPPGTDSNTCNADSGGPLFVDFGTGPVVAGTTSGGTSSNCLPTDQSYDANVFTYGSWLQSVGGSDLGNTTCGSLPQIGSADAHVSDLQGQLSATSAEGRHSFTVPVGASVLRVTMNAVDDGVANFDLYVKQGSPPTTSSYDCARTGSGEFAACEFAAPAAGTWNVLVERVSGSGSYQVTATSFVAGSLGVGLSSGTTSVARGASFPFTLALSNHSGTTQSFALLASVVLPGGSQVPLIPATGLQLPDGGGFSPSLSLPIPAGAPVGTWAVGAILWEPGVGIVSQSLLTFQVQ